VERHAAIESQSGKHGEVSEMLAFLVERTRRTQAANRASAWRGASFKKASNAALMQAGESLPFTRECHRGPEADSG